MCKKNNESFTTTIWDRMNKFFAVITSVTTIVFIIFFVLCIKKDISTEKQSFFLSMCSIFVSLASAFFIAWITRLYELKHKKIREEKALILSQPYLKKISATINEFFPQLRSFATIENNDTIQYTNDIIYYTDPGIEHFNRNFVDLNEEFEKAYSKLNNDLSACLHSPIFLQCNEEVITLLTKIKLNGLTHNLFEIYKVSSTRFFRNYSFCSLYKDYCEFADLYESLCRISNVRQVGKLKELDLKEKEKYIIEIEKIRPQVASLNRNERIYKGYDRIQ